MSFLEATTSTRVLLAVAFFVGAGVAEPLLEQGLKRLLDDNAALDWSWEHVFAPALRATMIVGFVLLAYPALFGVHHAPSLQQLLADGELRVNKLVGVLFLCTLVCPLVPLFHRRSSLILSLQSIIATAAAFSWLTAYLGATAAGAWPGAATAALLLGIAVLGQQAAASLAREFGADLDRRFNTTGLDRVVLNVVELLSQAPIILVYGYALGLQIAI